MIYIFGISVLFLIVLVLVKLLSKQWQKQNEWGIIMCVFILIFTLLNAPYRIARIWEGIKYLFI